MSSMKKAILGALKEKNDLSEKKLKKNALKLLGDDAEDKDEFDATLAKLVSKGKISCTDGSYTLAGETTEKKPEEEKPSRKRANSETSKGDEAPKKKVNKAELKVQKAEAGKSKYEELWKNGEKFWREGTFDADYLRTNPDKVTRLFCGNLNKKVTEEELRTRLPGIVYIKWITDKQTGEFYGSSFLEMKDPASAALAVLQDKTKFMGRPLKLYYCPPKPGDKWPPQHIGRNMDNPNINPESSSTHSMKKNGGNEPPRREKTPKPEGCRKLFAGNLSYNIDDATIVDFFKDCGELTGLRWLTRQGTEEFRGAGYIEFATTEQADKAMALDGKELLGRNVRLDWTN